MGPGQGRAAPPYLSSPFYGEGDRVAVEGAARRLDLRRVGWKRRRRPLRLVGYAADPPPHRMGRKEASGGFRRPRQAFGALSQGRGAVLAGGGGGLDQHQPQTARGLAGP